jgi:hypothetical protein
MANEENAAPWTIKAVPVHIREKAVRYARMEGVTMAEWLAKAVETQAEKQEGNQVQLPSKPTPSSLPSPTIDVSEATAALQSMAAAAAAGLPISKAAVRDTVALIRDHVRVGRGLPPRQTRQQIGQTMRLNHANAAVNGADLLPTAVDTEDGDLPIAQAVGAST